MREEIKKILLEMIYTPDAKPRFIGGDLDMKLYCIDQTVEKLYFLANPVSLDTHVTKAMEYLSVDTDEEAIEMVKAIQKQAKIDPSMMVDWIDGVSVCEVVENRLSCEEFLGLCDYNTVKDELKDN